MGLNKNIEILNGTFQEFIIVFLFFSFPFGCVFISIQFDQNAHVTCPAFGLAV